MQAVPGIPSEGLIGALARERRLEAQRADRLGHRQHARVGVIEHRLLGVGLGHREALKVLQVTLARRTSE